LQGTFRKSLSQLNRESYRTKIFKPDVIIGKVMY
jgi:hypothetical protein